MKVLAIVQARMSSERFPGKVLAEIQGRPSLELLLKRLSNATRVDQIVVVTSTEKSDDAICLLVESLGIDFFRGSLRDVRSRFVGAARESSADVIVRITADCPLVDPDIVDQAVQTFLDSDCDYVSNVNPPTFPHGLDVEVFSVEGLFKATTFSAEDADLEHVTTVLRSKEFRQINFEHIKNLSGLRWTVDWEKDLEVMQNVFRHFHPKINFSWLEVLTLFLDKPELFDANKHLSRNTSSYLPM